MAFKKAFKEKVPPALSPSDLNFIRKNADQYTALQFAARLGLKIQVVEKVVKEHGINVKITGIASDIDAVAAV